jgi:hypothetical protein
LKATGVVSRAITDAVFYLDELRADDRLAAWDAVGIDVRAERVAFTIAVPTVLRARITGLGALRVGVRGGELLLLLGRLVDRS